MALASDYLSVDAPEEQDYIQTILSNNYYNIGAIHYQLQQPDSGAFYFEKSLESMAEDNLIDKAMIWSSLASFYNSTGNYQKAMDMLEQILGNSFKLDKGVVEKAHEYYGTALKGLNKPEEAIAYWENGLQLAEGENLQKHRLDLLG